MLHRISSHCNSCLLGNYSMIAVLESSFLLKIGFEPISRPFGSGRHPSATINTPNLHPPAHLLPKLTQCRLSAGAHHPLQQDRDGTQFSLRFYLYYVVLAPMFPFARRHNRTHLELASSESLTIETLPMEVFCLELVPPTSFSNLVGLTVFNTCLGSEVDFSPTILTTTWYFRWLPCGIGAFGFRRKTPAPYFFKKDSLPLQELG